MSKPMTAEELQSCRERAEAFGAMLAGDALRFAGECIPSLLATIEARDEEVSAAQLERGVVIPFLHSERAKLARLTVALSEHRHAALFAAGVRGGPGAWRWSYDPEGTTLGDEAAWERLLGEMRDLGSVEALRMLRRSVVANAGRLSLRGPSPRWAHVMSAAGLGSTSATALCVAAGFDPDEEVGKWPEPCETCAEEEEDEEAEDE